MNDAELKYEDIVRNAIRVKAARESITDKLVNRYLRHEMKEGEVASFEERLKYDKTLRERLDASSAIMSAVRVRKARNNTKKKRLHHRLKVEIAVTATAVVMLASCCGNIINDKVLSYKGLTELERTLTQTATYGSNVILQTIDLYNKGDVNGAIRLLDRQINNPYVKQKSDFYYAKGLMLLSQIGHQRDAVKTLRLAGNASGQNILNKIWFRHLYQFARKAINYIKQYF